MGGLLKSPNLRRFGAFTALPGGVFHSLAFLEGLETFRDDVAVMDEQILSTIVRRDKTISLLIVEPFYRTACHNRLHTGVPFRGPVCCSLVDTTETAPRDVGRVP